jgi:hypothetical protein
MILEGLVTTRDLEGALNVAPMGPLVDDSWNRLRLRPFATSQTCRNLRVHPWGVFHVTDDVLLLAQAAIGELRLPPETFPAEKVPGSVVAAACRWYEFEVESIDDSRERTEIEAVIGSSSQMIDSFW